MAAADRVRFSVERAPELEVGVVYRVVSGRYYKVTGGGGGDKIITTQKISLETQFMCLICISLYQRRSRSRKWKA